MQLTFLGTAGMVPTKERNVSGIYLSYDGEGILFDCGEGTQRQMNITGIKRTTVRKILISHWHGDHVSGIIGLIQTLGNNETPPRLTIYGPRETKKRMEHMMQTCIFDNRVELDIVELDPKEGELLKVFENENYRLDCAKLEHGMPALGYSFIDKERLNIDTAKQKKLGVLDGPHLRKIKNGETISYKGKEITPEMMTYTLPQKKIAYVSDTEPCPGASLLAEDADIVICESTFSSALQEKALERKHMSSKDAALIASQAGAKQLVLTHFSQRYKNTQEVEEDARNYFDNVVSAYDFMKIKL